MDDKVARRVGREMGVNDSDEIPTSQAAYSLGTYAGAGSVGPEDEFGTGSYAAAGLGYARTEINGGYMEAKGPNAAAGASLSNTTGVRAFAKAEVGSFAISAGPVKTKIGLAADTGIGFGPSGVEAKVLGTGLTLGREVGVSLFGSELKFKLW